MEADGLTSRLALWRGTRQQLEATAVPLDAEAVRLGKEMERERELYQAAEDAVTNSAKAATTCQVGMHRIEAGEALPTEDAILEVRTRRDAAWTELRHGLHSGGPAIPPGLPDTVESLLHLADELVDARHRELARVQEWERHRIEAQRLAEERPSLLAALDIARVRAQQADAAWEAAWRLAGVVPQGPAAMREWVRDRALVLAAAKDAHNAAADHGRLAEQEATLRRRLSQLLPAGSGDEFAGLLRQGTQRLQQLDVERAGRLNAAARAEKARKDLAKASREQVVVATDVASWVMEWTPVADRLGLPPSADPALATELLTTGGSWIRNWSGGVGSSFA